TATMPLFWAIGCGQARPIAETPRCPREAACIKIHAAGISDPGSPDFHGTLIESLGWNFGVCRQCHGDDLAGGTSGKSCLTCHAAGQGGPTGCTTCHGQPPLSGAHALHGRFDCSECHVKPAVYTDVGHLFRSDGSVINEAQVTFGALARVGAASPSWDGK